MSASINSKTIDLLESFFSWATALYVFKRGEFVVVENDDYIFLFLWEEETLNTNQIRLLIFYITEIMMKCDLFLDVQTSVEKIAYEVEDGTIQEEESLCLRFDT